LIRGDRGRGKTLNGRTTNRKRFLPCERRTRSIAKKDGGRRGEESCWLSIGIIFHYLKTVHQRRPGKRGSRKKNELVVLVEGKESLVKGRQKTPEWWKKMRGQELIPGKRKKKGSGSRKKKLFYGSQTSPKDEEREKFMKIVSNRAPEAGKRGGRLRRNNHV